MRKNEDGALRTLTYGNISSVEPRPIEIKPFYHFYPGSSALTFATFSCNFRCPWCQNHQISKRTGKGKDVSPDKMLELALQQRCDGLCASFQEPTLLFEYCIDLFPMAKKAGLYNTFVSNGYMTEDALRALVAAGLDGLKVDVKGDAEVYRNMLNADVRHVWDTIALARTLGIHVEVVHLMVTRLNDDPEKVHNLVIDHLRYAGADVPLHFTRYHPECEYKAQSTSIRALETACKIAKEMGVRYPYIGNVPGHKFENTFCHGCGSMLIERSNCDLIQNNIVDGKCPKCGARIPGRF